MIKAKYVLVCDEVRREDNGKFIILGLYTPDLLVPQIPFVTPAITFFLCLESDRPGRFRFNVKLEHLETGGSLAEAMGQLEFGVPGMAIAPVRFGNLQFAAGGSYIFSVNIDGQTDPITTQFNVVLNIPGVSPGAAGAPPRLGM
jgi:hypothetical protein